MAVQPQLVATDLDGTLLRPDKSVSARTAAALDKFQARGGRVILVTGRPVRWLAAVYEQLREPVPAVCANGAVVFDPHTDTVLRADPLDPEIMAEVARRLRAEVPDVVFAVEVDDGRLMRHCADWPAHWNSDHPSALLVTDPADLLTAPAVKLLARSSQDDPDVFVQTVAGALAGLAEATHSSKSGLVEISAAGVTKAAGLAWLCTRLDVTAAEVVAFGDMPNDVPMLTWAGRAVAMANAHPAVREIADAVTASNADDGVAAYLETLLDQQELSSGQ
ncbi:Cof-type HAD-IIB family hydrolase [Solwaraspora sp. WMMD406]|uniref:HAD family hydrolase n=1 Tax=Solwaraspora sp. WMMD406 TaxID=3016095 RepID=UPI00241702AD|nr:Cof-type HAD-IIB family hydrolase [Solwaraspora sp. WMMD406]MDG4763120.1 Cof-type HAD-IIB family hydrolase [Solwaraspora sp. WMMD406]